MRKCLLLFILTTCSQVGFAQFTDNFTDGDFTDNPVWGGDINNFEIDSIKQLHLSDTITNTSYLTTESNSIINGFWEFNIRLDFSPSSSNFAKVYLVSDNTNITSSLNGMYVRIGGEAGAIDDVSLFVQNGLSSTKIIDGIDGSAAVNPELKIKVTRDSIGNWELFVDTSNQYFLEGIAFENSITTSSYFGVYCKYTSTRADKFWFDNFNVSGDSAIQQIPQEINTNDIIINEIYADPSTSIGLPEVEYIELFNTTDFAINLTDWTITIGSTEKVFPPSIIEPDSFVLLIKENAIDSFSSNISTIGFSSISLTNGGTSITLKNTSDSIINAVSFTDYWYNDSDKDDGGWSLELINPNSLCLGKENWSASNDVLGGTPGKRNSISSNLNNLDSLYIINVFSSGIYDVIIKLNRGLDSLQLANTSNYFISNLGVPNFAVISNNNETITLTFSDSLIAGVTYTFQLQNILSDCIGNSLDTTTQHIFTLPFTASENEVLINEIYADPSPSIGLPDVEYIELYNRTDIDIDLTDWTITIGTTKKEFPAAIIEADSFVLLIKENAIDSFSSNISTIGFSSISLTNGGAELILKDNTGKIINAVNYNDDWYHNDDKKEGGWSIERVNANLYCETHNNWRASISTIGGTPGKENSVAGESVYIEPFRISKAYPLDSNRLAVFFNKQVDSILLSTPSIFDLNIGNIINSNPLAPYYNSVILTADYNFIEDNVYEIAIPTIYDCSGNSISNSLTFGIADSILANELIINEILFNPKDDGVDYVEIYNNSSHFFDLANYRLANFFEFGGTLNPENAKIITEGHFIIKPSEYLILTTDSAKVKAQYKTENPYAFIEMESLPSLSNDQGTICIVHQSLSQIIDAFAYDEQMHFSLLETEDGVSLERLDKQAETQKNNNWHSAASTVGFGTPTYQNSQVYQNQTSGEVTVNPKSFSPNNDGYKDVCAIHWDFSKTNLMATISIFDSEGIRVNQLMNNKMIGNKGSEIWEGTSENGAQLKTGMYIVFMQVFSEDGEVESYKKVVVLHN